jgi:hypothetical protein
MKRERVLLFIGVACLAFAGILLGCTSQCGEEVLLSKHAPKGDAIAELVRVNCGATAAYSEDLRISSKSFAREKQVLFSYYHPAKLSFVWEDEHTVRLDCTDCQPKNITPLTTIASPFRIKTSFTTESSAAVESSSARKHEPCSTHS